MSAPPASETDPPGELHADVELLGDLLGRTVAERDGPEAFALVEGLRRDAIRLRAGTLPGGRDAFADRVGALDLSSLEQVAHAFTQFFHLINVAEEQHRIRTLRRWDQAGAPVTGSIAAACDELAKGGASPDEVRALLARLFVMPVLTAHPTEARRRTLLDHLARVSASLDLLDDPRPGARERARVLEELRETVVALYCTDETRTARPTPADEVRAGVLVFERTLLDVTPAIYRELEDGLARSFPGESLDVGPFLRWGTWIGGDRDGNPFVVAETTREAFNRQRRTVLDRYLLDVNALGRELSVSYRRVGAWLALAESIEADRARMPDVAARARRYAGEPWREKLLYVRARLEATRARADGGYPDARAYRDDLDALERGLEDAGLPRLARGRLRDARRRAEVFGFHLATLDLRQHSQVHEAAVAELLARGGQPGYELLDEPARAALLGRLLDRADVGAPRDRGGLSPSTRELLATLDVVGRARRELGPEACERYVVSFTSAPSDLLEVLFLARSAHLAPDELRPVPLLEQLQDLDRAGAIASALVEQPAMRAAMHGELEVMIGYSDSGKQAGYVASAVALRRAQEALAAVADGADLTLTVFHGRGGAVGRGGGPANRAIRAQPPRAIRGRLRVTEQGETIAARYGRPEIARRDLEQMVSAVLVSSLAEKNPWPAERRAARDRTLDRAAAASLAAYSSLIADRDRLVRYAVQATPILEVMELPIASRPSSRRPGLSFEELRAIPWVFSWNQSRHGIPGWYGLGAALDALVASEGVEPLRALCEDWPFFRALVDNAQLALARADVGVAEHYARLADDDARAIFRAIAGERALTVARVLELTQKPGLLGDWPTLARTVAWRNPYVDVLSHVQIELLRRLGAGEGTKREQIRDVLFITINGIAAGLQTAG